MVDTDLSDLVEWDPDLSPEAQAYAVRLREEIESDIALIRRVRLMLGLSQAEVAAILQVTQSNVSKMESRDETVLSVIARLVAAKGGKVRLQVETAEGDEFRFAVAS